MLALGLVRPDSQLLKRERVRSKRCPRKNFTVSTCESPWILRQKISDSTAGSFLCAGAPARLFIYSHDAEPSFESKKKIVL